MDGGEARPFLADPEQVSVSDGTTPSIGVHATPYDGEHVMEVVAHYSPIYATASDIYVVAAVTRSATDQSRAARLNKSYVSQEDVQLRAATHPVLAESGLGHRAGSIAVASGRVHAAGVGHNEAWRDRSSTSDLASLTATTNPTADTAFSYFRHFVNGTDAYLAYRHHTGTSLRPFRIDKWNGSAWAAWETITTGTGYVGDMAFASDGTIYVTAGFVPGDTSSSSETGFPRRQGSIVKTSDGGVTWQTLSGQTVTMPLWINNGGTYVFRPGSFTNLLLALDADDTPIVYTAWQPDDESYRSLYQAKWNGAGWDYALVAAHPTGASIGDIHVVHHNGTIVIAVGEYDTVDDPDFTSGGPFTAGKLWLYVTEDGAESYTRYQIHDGAGASYYSGAYLCPSSLAVDGVVRLVPLDIGTPTNHEIWELTLP